MNSRYLLDANAVSDLVRNPDGEVTKRIAGVGSERVCTSIVVAAELRFGAIKRGSQRLLRQLEVVLAPLDVLPLEAPADRLYG
jgi:tRNA(fMet)-specific endonuclease VapC